MAIKWPLANGVWSDAANWNDGTLPDVGDDVHADGKTVTIDQDVTVASIRNDQRSGGTAGGTYNFGGLSSYTVSANLISGTTIIFTLNQSKNITVIGNISGATACINLSTGILNFTGNLTGSTSGGVMISTSSSGVLNFIGNITGGLVANANGVQINSPSCIITGNITGGNNATAYGVLIFSSSGAGLLINGTSFGSAVTAGFNANSQASEITKVSAITNGVVGLVNGTNTVVQELEFGNSGQSPFTGSVKFKNNTQIKISLILSDNTRYVLSDVNNSVNEVPTEANVRQGTSYNSGNKLGTLAVPDPSNVRKDIPTDNTVGTAELTGEDILNAILTSENPVAERLRNVSTVQTTGDQISTI